MPNFSPPPPPVTALSKEISLDYGRTALDAPSSVIYNLYGNKLGDYGTDLNILFRSVEYGKFMDLA